MRSASAAIASGPSHKMISPKAARPGVTPPPGDYRCRTIKLGSQGGEDGLGYVVYGWFACRIEATPNGLKFAKETGSQRPSGLLFPENDRHMLLLGSMALAQEPAANSYGRNSDRDLVAVLERIGEARWRLVLPRLSWISWSRRRMRCRCVCGHRWLLGICTRR